MSGEGEGGVGGGVGEGRGEGYNEGSWNSLFSTPFVSCIFFSPACAGLVHVSTVFYQFCDLVEKLEKLDEDLQEVRKLAALSCLLPSFHLSLLSFFRLLHVYISLSFLLLFY